MNKKLKLKLMSLLLLSTSIFAIAVPKTTFAANSVIENQVNMPPTHRDLVFANVKNDDGSDRELKMNVFRPAGATGATPVLVFIHGGAWMMGSYECDDALNTTTTTSSTSSNAVQNAVVNDSAYKTFKRVLNNGITFVSVDYRLSGEAAFPAQIHDVKGAIRYLRANADKLGIDPERIAVAGNSAGGHLTVEVATTSDIEELEGNVGGNLEYSSKVMAAVDFYGPTDMFTMAAEMSPSLQSVAEAEKTHDSYEAAEAKLLGFNKPDQGVFVLRHLRDTNRTDSPYWPKVQLAELATPLNFVTPDDAPMFIAHGGKDIVVPIAQSLRLKDALTDAGVEHIFMSNSEAPHGYQGEYVNDAAIKWVSDKLLAK